MKRNDMDINRRRAVAAAVATLMILLTLAVLVLCDRLVGLRRMASI